MKHDDTGSPTPFVRAAGAKAPRRIPHQIPRQILRQIRQQTLCVAVAAALGCAAMTRPEPHPDARPDTRPDPATTASVLLSCSAVATVPVRHLDGVCGALQQVLAMRTGQPVQQVRDPESAPESAAAASALQLQLHFPRGGPSALTARLSWRSGGDTGSGPDLSFGVVDTALDDRFYDQFARQIFRSVPLPLP